MLIVMVVNEKYNNTVQDSIFLTNENSTVVNRFYEIIFFWYC